MALTQEEIRIRAGLDYSQVTAGLRAVSHQVGNLAMEIPKKLGSILKAHVGLIAVSLVDELKPLANMALDKFLGVGPDAAKRKAEAAAEAAAAKEKLEAAKALFETEKQRDEFERGSDKRKLEMLKEAAAAEDKKAKEAEQTAAELLRQQGALEMQIASLREIAKEQEIIKGLMGQQFPAPTGRALEAGRELRKANAQLADVSGRQVAAETTAYTAGAKALELARARDDFKEKHLNYPESMPAKKFPDEPRSIYDGLNRYMEQTRASSRTWQGHIDAVNSFGKPPQPTPQTEPGTPGAPPLRVSIVDIEDK